MIGALSDGPICISAKIVIIDRTNGFRRFKAITDLHAFYCTDRHLSMGQSGIQLLKNRLPDSRRKPGDNTFHHASHGILIF